MPYRKANAAKSQKLAVIFLTTDVETIALSLSGKFKYRLKTNNAESNTAQESGRPHHIPLRAKKLINNGAKAVPVPSKALSTSNVELTLEGCNSAAVPLRVGTVKPKPSPKKPVENNNSRYTAACLSIINGLTASIDIAHILAMRPNKKIHLTPKHLIKCGLQAEKKIDSIA